jgi:predicted nucleotidyltransferase
MNLILNTLFGSHVYGTNTENSDHDYKSIYIPSKRELLLNKAKPTIHHNSKSSSKERNNKDDTDHEIFSLQQYCKLLADGQTVALDMLFIPDNFIFNKSYIWNEIKKNKNIFLNKNTASFIGYTKQQAAKYGVKGFRVNALRLILDFLNQQEKQYEKLQSLDIEKFVKDCNNEHIKITMCKGPNNTLAPHLEICNRKIPFHSTIKYAKELFQRLFNEYGHRALLAEKNENIDWKALMHAVRVAAEAKELLLTGFITFPRPEKELLLKIRNGLIDYKKVASIIEEGLITLEETQKNSILPDKPNYEAIDDLIYDIYLTESLYENS